MKILLLLALLFFPLFSFAHGGEEHEDEKTHQEEKNKNNKEDKSFVKLEKNVNINNGNFNFNLIQKTKKLYQGDKASFSLNITEVIENSFLENENLEFKSLSISIVNNNINYKKEKNNVYSFNYIFENSGSQKIFIEGIDKKNNKIYADFDIDVINLPINYIPYTINILVFITLIIILSNFYKKSDNIPQKLFFTIICLLVFLDTFFIVKNNVNFRIKPISLDNPNLESVITNQVIIPKETQLIFDILIKKVNYENLNNSINAIGSIKNFSKNIIEIKTTFNSKIQLNNIQIGDKVLENQVLGYMEQILSPQEKLSFKTNELDLKLKILDLENKIKTTKEKLVFSQKDYENSNIANQAKKIQLDRQIEQAKLNFELSKKDYERNKKLYNNGSSSSKKLQDSENIFNILKKEVESLETQKIYSINSDSLKKLQDSQFQLKLEQQEINLYKKQLSEAQKSINTNKSLVSIISPVNGIINNININNNVQEEANKNIISILNNEKMMLDAEVFEKDISKINKFKTGSFTLTAYPNQVFNIDNKENTFITIGNIVDSDKRTVKITFELSNKEKIFKEGMFANISLNISEPQKKLLIEKNNMFEDLGKKYVFVYKDTEIFEKREILTGEENQKYIEITKGLKEDEKIATEGIYQINSALIGKK
jgi:RND family efflux transporter MFP subunit